ncbi:PDZ domain-containing protein [Planctellipticum variicoloris]|uniref:PDZ domain-containing protein n=1 Tax=Planctellipticum variicoloris TaxID=3064265 RepID=UPI0030140974|nr:PDZ domain-containing protein [Planctomycetaceae bacterium SH412]
MTLTNWTPLVFATAFVAVTYPIMAQETPLEPSPVIRQRKTKLDVPPGAYLGPANPQTTKDTIVVDPNLFPRPPVPNVIFYRSPDQPADALKAQVVTVHETGTHWIGVGCSPATETLRSQLKLETGVGLVVDHVVPGSPADKAGLKVHDLLLKIQHGEKSIVLKDLADLSTAVSHVKTDEMQIELLRAGERQSLKMTAEARPNPVSYVPSERFEIFATTGEAPEQGTTTTGVYRLNVAGPAFAFAHVRKFGGLPEGVTVSITRTGNEPAKVTVKRGEQSWETTEKDLSVLPEDLRGPINEMLQHPPLPVRFPYPLVSGSDGPGPGVLPPQPPVPPQAFRIEKVVPGQPQKVQKEALQQSREALEREMDAKLEKLQKLQLQEQKAQLEALDKKIEALQQAVEKLQAPPAEKPQRNE